MDLRINHRLTIPDKDLQVQQVRSGGPGGQNVNKVATKIVLRWQIAEGFLTPDVADRLRQLAGSRFIEPDAVQIAVQDTRSADRNLQLAYRRLRELVLAALHRPKPRKKTKPSAGSVRRRLESKNQRSEKKARRAGVRDIDGS